MSPTVAAAPGKGRPMTTNNAIKLLKREGISRPTPEPCRVCGAPDVEAHHRDYDAPDAHLQVDWLCGQHHALEHGTQPWTKQTELFPAMA